MDISTLLSNLDTLVAAKQESQENTTTVSFRIDTAYAKAISDLAHEKGLMRTDIYKEIITAFINQLQSNKN